MTTTLPAPLVPAEVDLRDFAFMPLDVLRLRDSELSATPDAEVFRCAVLSWCISWHQIPAASLPDDDVSLSRLLGFGRDLKGWKKVRASGGLRGWVKCSDGRLYHPVVAEKANDAWREKTEYRARKEKRIAAARAAAGARWHEESQSDEHCESHPKTMRDASETDANRTATAPLLECRKGQGQGQGLSKPLPLHVLPSSVVDQASQPPAQPEASSRGSRLPEDWQLPKAWGEWALAERRGWSAEHVRRVADKFRDHWRGKPGKDGRKADWAATWRNWVRNEPDDQRAAGSGQTLSASRAATIAGLTGQSQEQRNEPRDITAEASRLEG